MKHTKNILKSLLITVMALSLLAVSCKKDGSKPTSPETVEVNAEIITSVLTAIFLGTVDESGTASLFDITSEITPSKGTATINTAKGKKVATIKEKLKASITMVNSPDLPVTLTSDVDTLTDSKKDFTLTMKPANANVKFASDVTDGTKYTYKDGAASLVVTINEVQ